MAKFKAVCSAALMAVLVLTMHGNSCADRRSYVWTYEYQTMPKASAEIEYYLTEEQKDIHKARPNTWKHWVELEYGITDRWDISMYQQFKQSNPASGSGSFEYDGFKVRTRYRILEKGKLPVDTLLYAEYIRNDNLERPNVFEGKMIFAKDVWGLNFAYNQILKQEFGSGSRTEHEFASGVSWAVISNFKIGIEAKGNYSDKKYYIGPTAAWSSSKLWISLGAAGGLSEKSDDLQARLIIGVPF